MTIRTTQSLFINSFLCFIMFQWRTSDGCHGKLLFMTLITISAHPLSASLWLCCHQNTLSCCLFKYTLIYHIHILLLSVTLSCYFLITLFFYHLSIKLSLAIFHHSFYYHLSIKLSCSLSITCTLFFHLYLLNTLFLPIFHKFPFLHVSITLSYYICYTDLPGTTVKPVYKGHSRETEKVATVDRWPF